MKREDENGGRLFVQWYVLALARTSKLNEWQQSRDRGRGEGIFACHVAADKKDIHRTIWPGHH